MTLEYPIYLIHQNRLYMAWSTAIGNFFEFLNFLLKIRKAGDRVKDVVEIYKNMDFVLQPEIAKRFVVVRTHNGDGKIRPGVPLYASIVYETTRLPLRPVKHLFQRHELDEQYLIMLSVMYGQKSVRVAADKLPDCFLKDFYEREKITYGELHFLHEDKKALYYCSIVTTDENEQFEDPTMRTNINIAVNNIRNIFKK